MSSSDTQELGLKIAYGALLTMAVVPIYIGSFASLSGMKRPANAPKKKSTSPLEDSDDEESISETLSANDAWMFPIMGSITLFSLYLIFRYVDKEYINLAITAYFGLMGTLAMAKTGLLFAQKLVPTSLLQHIQPYRLTFSTKGKDVFRLKLTIVHLFLLLASVVLTVYYSLTKNWIASNAFGLAFSINAIQLLSLDSFKTGMILLSGLFLYDIFWVFGTEVMVSVAKSFDAPIKVIWPRDIIDYVLNSDTKTTFAMLGLGDIVIPGIFVALCLRYDRHMAWKKNPSGDFRSTQFSKPYFTSCLIAYFLGLVTTMAVMHIFHAAQPALLYLSPACILSVLITAAIRGELSQVFQYTTEEEKTDEKTKKKSKKSTKDQDEKVTKETTENDEEEFVNLNAESLSPSQSPSTKTKKTKKTKNKTKSS
ncbi:signal peptide peptidase-domain-containing protein [Halteromyces radiatus]|uniref:signal peptide peptidase-domain-containing protein n=1 Tax=Halteromyces radiatus TaxID=101107 RepID=UPI00221EF108|nr:signal peptide peptidase-domain-containing protein [Halteromyces radiatus]KAI8099409.1 signal peptide peptidase-domain-containing protein [Halteromyces radiatus]